MDPNISNWGCEQTSAVRGGSSWHVVTSYRWYSCDEGQKKVGRESWGLVLGGQKSSCRCSKYGGGRPAHAGGGGGCLRCVLRLGSLLHGPSMGYKDDFGGGFPLPKSEVRPCPWRAKTVRREDLWPKVGAGTHAWTAWTAVLVAVAGDVSLFFPPQGLEAPWRKPTKAVLTAQGEASKVLWSTSKTW